MVIKNTKSDKLDGNKKFSKRDTSYSSFWLYNKELDIKSEHFKDSFVNYYDEKELLSEFNPTIAKNIISFWSNPYDIIYDPFSGRTRALVSYAMNRHYIGCEVSKDVVIYMKKKIKDLFLIKQNDELLSDIINDDCLNIHNHYNELQSDLVFTCPPYWNLEKYEDCEGQLSSIKKYDEFLENLILRLNIAINTLKKGGFCCIVIGDFRKNKKYIALHSDIIQKMKTNKKILLHDVVAVQNIPFNTAAFYFGSRKKNKQTAKAHEYILVYKKIK